MKRRILSIIMVLSMCLSMLPVPALAAEDTGLCDHHTAHTAECHYAEAVAGTPCSHEHTAECYTAGVLPDGDSFDVYATGEDTNALNCQHQHDDTCGYVAAVEAHDCHFECAECAAPVCDCGTDDPAIHATTCAVYVAPENPVCYCAEKCTEVNEWCDVCGFDYTACTGTDTAVGYAEGTIDLSQYSEGATIDISEDSVIIGDGNEYKVSLNIAENATVTFDVGASGVKLGGQITVADGKTLTLLVAGDAEHTVNGGISLGNGSNVIIEGDLTKENNKLTVTATGSNAGIGANNGVTAGDITIRNARVDATGSGSSSAPKIAGAGIGTAKASMGNILIVNSIVTAAGGYYSEYEAHGAAIGMGSDGVSMGNITLIDSEITASHSGEGHASIIGAGPDFAEGDRDGSDIGTMGDIIITNTDLHLSMAESTTDEYAAMIGTADFSGGGLSYSVNMGKIIFTDITQAELDEMIATWYIPSDFAEYGGYVLGLGYWTHVYKYNEYEKHCVGTFGGVWVSDGNGGIVQIGNDDGYYVDCKDGSFVHNFDKNCGGTCSDCGVTYLVVHTMGTAATCTELAVCSVCGESYGDIDEDAHSYGDWVSNGDNTHTRTCANDSTHTENGDCSGGTATCTTLAVCENCGESYGEVGGHSPDAAGYTVNADGTHSYTCSSCGNLFTESHTFTDGACTGCGVIGGYCGEEGNEQNVIWTYANGTLTISGTGAIADQLDNYDNRPWEEYVDQITTIVVNDGITSIGEAAFLRFQKLTTAKLPDSLTTISQQAFYGCTALKTVNFPANLKTIEGWAFLGCALESVTLPEGLTTIGYRAFSECKNLTSVTVPASVTTIDEGAFGYSPAKITVAEDNLNYSSDEHGVLFDKDKTTLIYCRPNIEVETYTIPSTVTEICKEAFYDCKNLATITIPDGVQKIGSSAFGGCEALTTITIPAGVTTIEANTFYDCTALTAVTIPAGVTTIDMWAFSGCTALTTVTIPASVTSIAYNAFSNCSALTTVNVPCTWDGSLYTFDEGVTVNKVHNWTNGTCTVCGEPCDHKDSTHTTANNNGDGTHSFTCSVCVNTVIEAHTGGTATCTTQAVCDLCGTSYGELAAHTPDADGECTVDGCGYQYAAKVGDSFYETIHKALRAAEGINGCTLTLLDDVTLTSMSSYASYVNTGAFTLDLNGKTLSSNKRTLEVMGSADLTIRDGIGSGKIVSTGGSAVYLSGGKLTIESGTFEGTLDGVFLSYDSTLIVKGGTFTGSRAMITGSGSDCVIDLMNIDPSGLTLKNNGNGTFAPTLPSGYAMINGSGEVVTSLSDEESATVKASLENATVTLDEDTFTYDGQPHKPGVTVTLDGKDLTEGTDYQVIYMMAMTITNGEPTQWFGDHTTSDPCVKADKGYYAVIVGMGNYYTADVFTLYENFVIQPRPLTIKADDQTILVGGQINEESVTVTEGSLVAGHTLTASIQFGQYTEAGSVVNQPGFHEDVLTILNLSCEIMDGAEYVTGNYSISLVSGNLTVVEHVHEWSYSADGATITATCANTDGHCPDAEQSITISAVGKTYDGTPVTAELDISGEDLTAPTITYFRDGEEINESAIKPGTYTASITLGEGENAATASVEFAITIPEALLSPETPNGENGWYTSASLLAPDGYQISTIQNGTFGASLDLEDGTCESFTYWLIYEENQDCEPVSLTWTGSIQIDGTAPTVSGEAASVTDSTASITVSAKDENSDVASTTLTCTDSSVTIGELADGAFPVSGMQPNTSYTFTLTVKDAAGNEASATVQLTTQKGASSVTKAPAANKLTYTGTAQTLVTAGEAKGGTMQYSLDNQNWSASIPTGTIADTYTVYYKVVGDSNHNDTDVKPVEVTIAMAEVSIAAAPTPNTLTYIGEGRYLISAGEAVGGTMLYSLTENGDYTTSIPQGTNAGDYTVWYYVQGDANHNDSAKDSVSVNIAKATVTVTADAKSKPYGTDNPTLTYTSEGLLGGDTLTGALETTATKTSNVGEYDITVGSLANSNYTIDFVGAKLTITKAASSCTAPATVSGLTFNGGNQNLITAGTATGGTMQYSLDGSTWSETIPSGKDAKTYTVYYRVVGDGNHVDNAGGSVSVTIAPKVITNPVIEGIDAQYLHTGSAITPVPTAVKDGNTVIDPSEYTLDYENNINEGTATLKIVDAANGNYTVSGSKTFQIVVHAHVWNYSAIGNTITATCSGTIGTCPDAEQSIKISAEGKTYDGTAVAATLTGSIDGVVTPTISYSGNTNAGTYTASITIEGVTASVAFTISKANQVAPNLSKTDETLKGQKNGTITGVTNKMEYATTSGGSYTAITGTTLDNLAAGTYYVRLAADANHNASPDTAVTIAAGEAITVTYDQGTQTASGMPAQLTDLSYGTKLTKPADPTANNTDFAFVGWYKDAACTAEWDFNADTLIAESVTLYAKWKQVYFSVAAAIKDHEGNVYHGTVEVDLMRGNNLIDSVTGTSGSFTFSKHVEAGMYNLVAIYTDDAGEHTKTELIDVDHDGSYELQLPAPGVNSHLDVSSNAETPPVMVGGLDDEAASVKSEADQASGGETVKEVSVTMDVEGKKEAQVNDDVVQKIENAIAEAPGSEVSAVVEYLEIKVNKEVVTDSSKTTTPITETTNVIEIVIPFNFSGRTGIKIIRHHGDTAAALVQDNTKGDGTFYLDTENGYIHIFTKRFSTYAVSYITSYNVTFDVNGGDGSNSNASTNANGTVVLPADPTRSGYTFKGWYTASSGGTKVTSDYVFSGDTTVYAQWTQNYTPPAGGGGYVPSTYSITVEDATNGTVKADRTRTSSGTTVTLTVTPDTGYTLETLMVTTSNGKEVELTNKGNGQYTFKMPSSKVTIKATFMDDNTMLNFFVDVPAGAYYYDAVLWAAESGITSGTSATTFSPDNPCTRAQMATFLWRAAGSPEPVGTPHPFTDIPADAYYAKAVQWAYEQGITGGTSATTFSPDDTCTRGQMATFLWRNAGSKAPMNSANQFADVPAEKYYATAVQWAYEQKITSGTSATTFSPDDPCTRAQMVTFLYRFFVK